VYLILQ